MYPQRCLVGYKLVQPFWRNLSVSLKLYKWDFPGGTVVKNRLPMQGTRV